MSTFLQSSFNARSAENTSSIISPGNSTQTPLGAPNGSFTGAWVPSAFYSVLQITAKSDSLIQILVEQSFLGVDADQVSDAFYNTQEDINILRAVPFYGYITLPFMRILVSNIDAIENTVFELATKLTSTPPPQNVHVIVDSGTVTITGPLPEGTNSIGYVRDTAYNTTAEAWQALQIDAGNLKVVETNSADIKTAVESLNTNVVLCDTDNVVIESGTITVDNFPEIQLVAGENADFTFYPTAANNTATIYADGTQGTNVAGGWKYTNLSTGKINWYLYASASPDTDYKVADLTSMYTVINQQSSLGLAAAQNPWFMIYTRPDSGANSAGWYKSKLFFGSNAHTDILGLKLLYIGADPVAIHPEITGVNRIQLQFNSALSSNKQLIDVQTESIMLGSLQTTNNTPAGQFDFTFTQYGIDWVQTPAVLPIEFGKVQVQDVAAEASLVAINTKITTCNTGAVVISSGSVEVSNFPATQPVSGSVSIAGPLPEGTNSLGSVNAWAYNSQLEQYTSLTIDTDNLKVVEANSADILDAADSIDAKITTCDTGAVVISSGSVSVSNFPATQPISGSVSITGALPEGSNTIGVVRNMAYSVSEEIWQPIQIDAGHVTVVDTNSAGILTAADSIDAKITACNTGAVVISSGSVSVSNFPATQPISISSTVQVQDLPLENIAGHNAPRPVYNMVVGNWYRVANAGNTSGAVWIQIGAPLFNGASLPDIGVLFQCLYLYLNYSTTGTVWDEPYNTWEADNLIVDGQNLQVVEANSASIDSKITACNTGAVVISSGTITTQSSGEAESQASVPTVPVTSGVKWNGPSSLMANYSLVQVAIKASATSITTTMSFSIEYSPNNTDWFPSGEVLTYTNGGPLNIMTAEAKFTAMPYVRVCYDPPAMSTDTASNVIVYFLKKSA